MTTITAEQIADLIDNAEQTLREQIADWANEDFDAFDGRDPRDVRAISDWAGRDRGPAEDPGHDPAPAALLSRMRAWTQAGSPVLGAWMYSEVEAFAAVALAAGDNGLARDLIVRWAETHDPEYIDWDDDGFASWYAFWIALPETSSDAAPKRSIRRTQENTEGGQPTTTTKHTVTKHIDAYTRTGKNGPERVSAHERTVEIAERTQPEKYGDTELAGKPVAQPMIPLSYRSADDQLLVILDGLAQGAMELLGALTFTEVTAFADFALSRGRNSVARSLIAQWQDTDPEGAEENADDIASWAALPAET